MKLQSVRDYHGAEYPSLAEHLVEKYRGGKLFSFALTAALAALALVLGGCHGPS